MPGERLAPDDHYVWSFLCNHDPEFLMDLFTFQLTKIVRKVGIRFGLEIGDQVSRDIYVRMSCTKRIPKSKRLRGNGGQGANHLADSLQPNNEQRPQDGSPSRVRRERPNIEYVESFATCRHLSSFSGSLKENSLVAEADLDHTRCRSLSANSFPPKTL